MMSISQTVVIVGAAARNSAVWEKPLTIAGSLTSRRARSANFCRSLSVRFATLRNNFNTFSDASRSYGNTAPLITICGPI
jgi:hypothetical protein